MVQKSTIAGVSDKSGIFNVNIWHLYRGFSRKTAYFGDYLKISVRDTKPNNWILKKAKRKAILVRSKKELKISDGSYVNFMGNDVVVLKKRLTPEGSEVFGAILRSFKKCGSIRSFIAFVYGFSF